MLIKREDYQAAPTRDLLAVGLRRLCLDLNAAEASFWCVSPDGTHMELAINHGPKAALLETLSVPVSESVVGLVQATRMATAIGPNDAHHSAADKATGDITRAMVAAPVMGSEGVLGVVSVINPLGTVGFSGADLQRLTLAADALGKALTQRIP